MDARQQLYMSVRDKIESIRDTGGNRIIKKFTFWNNNNLQYERLKAHGFPAVFYKMQRVKWETMNETQSNPNHERFAKCIVELHVITECLQDNDVSYLRNLAICQVVAAAIENMSSDYFFVSNLDSEDDPTVITSVCESIQYYSVELNQPAIESPHDIITGSEIDITTLTW